MSLEKLKNDVCNNIDSMKNALLEVCHEIHSNPELAMEEVKATNVLSKAIKDAGLPVEKGVYGLETAFQSEFGAKQGPCVAILAEYDALPEIGHACGHNLIATSALGAGLALAKIGENLPGRIRLMGTPGEEGAGGKILMEREGAFEGVDAAMMMHPGFANLTNMPTVAAIQMEVIYHGRPSHSAALPEKGINALDGLILAYQSIAALRQHIKQKERIHGIITDGGQAPNIVPERAAGKFIVRAANADELEDLKKKVVNCFEAGALASGSRVEMHWNTFAYYDVRESKPLVEKFKLNAEVLGRKFTPIEELVSSGASTDMGNVSYVVPSIHPVLAASPMNCTIHHPDFTKYAGSEMGEAAAIDGAKALAMTTLDFLCDPQFQKIVKEHFEKNTY